jgi:ABC-type glycerol-3-phosphate transport system substrate-binding protein
MIPPGWLEPLDDRISRDLPNYVKEWPENVRAVYRGLEDGVTYAFPLDANAQLTYYRKDILEQEGINVPHDISTWDRLLETTKALKAANPNYLTGFCAKRPHWALDWMTSHMNANGGVYYNEDFTPGLDTDEARTALASALEYFDYSPPEVLNWEDGDLAEAIKAGSVVLAPNTWGGAAVTDPQFNPYADVMGIEGVPLGPGKKTHYIEKAGYGGRMGGAGYLIPKVISKEVKDEAWKFCAFLGTDCMNAYPDEVTDAYLSGGAQPGRFACMNDQNWWKPYPLLEGLSKALPNSVYKVWQIPEYSELSAALAVEAHEVFLKRKTIDQGIEDMNKIVFDIFKRAGRYD